MQRSKVSQRQRRKMCNSICGLRVYGKSRCRSMNFPTHIQLTVWPPLDGSTNRYLATTCTPGWNLELLAWFLGTIKNYIFLKKNLVRCHAQGSWEGIL